MGTLTRGRLGLLTLVITIVGLTIAPAAFAATACAGDYDVTIQAELLNPNSGFSPNEATLALATPIPAGDYTLQMVSFDDHSHKPLTQTDQVHEQWFLQLFDAQGAVVFQSGVSPDLPDGEDWLTFNTTATLTGEAVSMRVAHAAIGDNINSIVAGCAAFTAVPPPVGSIGDTVWLDANGNGWLDGAEVGIAGVTVTLGGDASSSAVTDGDGKYRFDDLAEGSYEVTVGTGPDGTALSTPAGVTVSLAEGEDFVDADFGFAPVVVEPLVGSIGDTVWFDANGNRWMDGAETGLAGIRVLLTAQGMGGAVEAITDADGQYTFSGLSAGSYDVTVDLTTAPANTDLTTVGAFTVNLGEGENFVDADFGFAQGAVLASAGIGDQVWMDDNLNGVFDAGEATLPGVTVSLLDTATGTAQTAVTGASGQYLFAALTAGTYEVSVVTSTAPESTALTTAGKYTITLSDGQMSLIADFGFAQALPTTGFETIDFGIAGLVLLLIGAAALALVRPGSKVSWHLVNAEDAR